jgi:putative membrane protein
MIAYKIFRILHFVGMIGWAGGLFGLGFFLSAYLKEGGTQRKILLQVRKISLAIVNPFMLLAWAGGLGMLVPHFSELYAKAGWMHTKLLLLVVLSALSGMFTAKIKKTASQQDKSNQQNKEGAFFGNLSFVVLLIFITIAILAVLQP